ncbi:MAG TPA: PAS domain-containing protein [Candidatus Cybelea sp.]|nr:PAS domain-containing protein [Candidatus Cybelea sp.]
MAEIRARVVDDRLKRFIDYIEQKRGDRAMLARRDIDPLEFKFILGSIILFDVLYEPLRFRYRLVGTRLAARRGFDLTGQLLDEHPDPVVAEAVRQNLIKIVETRGPAFATIDAPIDNVPGWYESLGIPLSDDGSIVNMVVVAVGAVARFNEEPKR